jgi:hypothetical protein
MAIARERTGAGRRRHRRRAQARAQRGQWTRAGRRGATCQGAGAVAEEAQLTPRRLGIYVLIATPNQQRWSKSVRAQPKTFVKPTLTPPNYSAAQTKSYPGACAWGTPGLVQGERAKPPPCRHLHSPRCQVVFASAAGTESAKMRGIAHGVLSWATQNQCLSVNACFACSSNATPAGKWKNTTWGQIQTCNAHSCAGEGLIIGAPLV